MHGRCHRHIPRVVQHMEMVLIEARRNQTTSDRAVSDYHACSSKRVRRHVGPSTYRQAPSVNTPSCPTTATASSGCPRILSRVSPSF